MAFYVGKILQPLLWPLTWALVALVVAATDAWHRGLRRRAAFFGAVFLFLFFPSLPQVANALMFRLETRYPVRALADYPSADAIVVLGGSVLPKLPPRQAPEELSGSRIRPAARLFLAGKAPYVVASSGPKYRTPEGEERYDADDMKDLLVEEGVPAEAVIPERKSRNTRENAAYSAEILKARGARRILLVTSAFHLWRAARLFEKQGFEVIPVPAAISSTEMPLSFDQLVPSADALFGSTKALKETIGRLMGY